MKAKRKRHRVIDPAKARAAAGGDPGWYRNIIPTTEDPGAAIPAAKDSGACPRSDGEETPDPFA